MRLTEVEQRYLECLARQMRFEDIMADLGMTREELGQFGPELFDRILQGGGRIDDCGVRLNLYIAHRKQSP